jgi:excisionase family DNA binding protein
VREANGCGGFLTLDQAAAFLNLPSKTLRDWRLKRQGPPAHKFGRALRYNLADLESWAEAQREDAR